MAVICPWVGFRTGNRGGKVIQGGGVLMVGIRVEETFMVVTRGAGEEVLVVEEAFSLRAWIKVEEALRVIKVKEAFKVGGEVEAFRGKVSGVEDIRVVEKEGGMVGETEAGTGDRSMP